MKKGQWLCENCGIVHPDDVIPSGNWYSCRRCTNTLIGIPRPTKRAADVKPRRAAKVKSRKVSRG